MTAKYLADTSAWNRSNATTGISERWAELLLGGDLAICPPVELELLYSARGPIDYRSFKDELAGLPRLELSSEAAQRAVDTQQRLAERSQHRGPTPTDLLVAAIAEAGGVTILHYDRHFDAIARLTGQTAEWLAVRGTVD